MMKRIVVISVLVLLAGFVCSAQREMTEYTDAYLDTVKLKSVPKINDYSMLGFSCGVTFSQQYFNPSKVQDWVFTPRYASVMFTHYEKMFNYLPYFGYTVGVAYSKEAYCLSTNPETGKPYETIRGAQSAVYDVIEVPFLIEGHYDASVLRILANLGAYGGYRLKIHRSGPSVEEELVDGFAVEDRRWDYGIEGGVGVGFAFDPVEIHLKVLGRYSLSTLWTPNMYQGVYNKYYYKFANPIDITVSLGVHFQLSRRRGKSAKALREEAYRIVYPEETQE